MDGSTGLSGASFSFSGIIAGYDHAISDRLRVGVLTSYSKPKLAQSAPASTVDVETRQLAMYGRYRDGPLRIDALASIASNDTSAARTVAAGGLTRVASSSYDGKTTSLYVETGYVLGGSFEIEPIVSVQWSRQRDGGYTETGAGALNLSVPGRDLDSIRTSIGVRAARSFDLSGTKGTLEGRAAWAHEFRGQGSISTRLAGDTSGTAFAVPTTDVPRDSVILGIGASIMSSRAMRFYADLSTDLNAGQRVHALSAGLRYHW